VSSWEPRRYAQPGDAEPADERNRPGNKTWGDSSRSAAQARPSQSQHVNGAQTATTGRRAVRAVCTTATGIGEVLEGLCGAVGGTPPQGVLQGTDLGALGAQPRTRRAGAGVVDPPVLGRPAQNLQSSFGHRQTLPADPAQAV